MKKFVVICLTLVMMLSLSITALAANGAFIQSPSRNPAPSVENFTPKSDEDGKCDAELIITPYKERNTLPEDLLALIENAYDQIANTDDLSTFNADLANLAKEKNIEGKDLAVSDLFDMRVEGCTVHKDHVEYEVEIEADTLTRFVGFLHMTKDGKWELIDNAKVVDGGKRLQFTVDDFSPYAIVVNRNEEAVEPGDNSMMFVWIMVAAASGLLLVALLAKKNKARNEL